MAGRASACALIPLAYPIVTYRSDIDGLRALSVLAVIAFHLNSFVPGGYVGVDIFLVISGFLIGAIVFHEIDSGSFSFGNFYKRRVRRIAPALIVTLLGSYAASLVLMRPEAQAVCEGLQRLRYCGNVIFGRAAQNLRMRSITSSCCAGVISANIGSDKMRPWSRCAFGNCSGRWPNRWYAARNGSAVG